MVRGAAFLLAALLHSACAAPRPGKEPALRSEEEDGFDNDGWLTDECSEDDEDDPDLHPFQCGYEGWCAQREADRRAREASSRAAGGSCSTDPGGRPRLPQNQVDEDAFAEAVWEGTTETELRSQFGMSSLGAVKRLKKRLALTFLRTGGQRPILPGLDELEVLWEAQPHLRPVDLATRLGCGLRTLQRHFAHVGFCPKPAPDDEPVLDALYQLMNRGWCSNIGVSFATACLKKYDIYATAGQIRRCLQQLDPKGVRRRAKEAAKTKFVYSVPGPRSLYHIDAHEKLAKIWGIWIHICVDGYSRYIVYLKVSTDKLSDTVREIFLEAMNQPHPGDPTKRMWASRVRGDKGSENTGWAQEQTYRMGTGRGSVILGRSVQNCRAEYMWARVRRHVTDYFREIFFEVQRRGLLDTNSPTDLHCLQAIFVSQVQEACDDFCQMWNDHHIRGRRTEAGHGGAVPSELLLDPVHSEAVLDDDAYNQQGDDTYGVDEPIRGDDDPEELSFTSKHVIDPLDGFELLQAVRSAYFQQEPLDTASDGVNDYIRYRFVCSELLEACTFVGDNNEIDWLSFSQSRSNHDEANELHLRHKLAWLAVNLPEPDPEREPDDAAGNEHAPEPAE